MADPTTIKHSVSSLKSYFVIEDIKIFKKVQNPVGITQTTSMTSVKEKT